MFISHNVMLIFKFYVIQHTGVAGFVDREPTDLITIVENYISLYFYLLHIKFRKFINVKQIMRNKLDKFHF